MRVASWRHRTGDPSLEQASAVRYLVKKVRQGKDDEARLLQAVGVEVDGEGVFVFGLADPADAGGKVKFGNGIVGL